MSKNIVVRIEGTLGDVTISGPRDAVRDTIFCDIAAKAYGMLVTLGSDADPELNAALKEVAFTPYKVFDRMSFDEMNTFLIEELAWEYGCGANDGNNGTYHIKQIA